MFANSYSPLLSPQPYVATPSGSVTADLSGNFVWTPDANGIPLGRMSSKCLISNGMTAKNGALRLFQAPSELICDNFKFSDQAPHPVQALFKSDQKTLIAGPFFVALDKAAGDALLATTPDLEQLKIQYQNSKHERQYLQAATLAFHSAEVYLAHKDEANAARYFLRSAAWILKEMDKNSTDDVRFNSPTTFNRTKQYLLARRCMESLVRCTMAIMQHDFTGHYPFDIDFIGPRVDAFTEHLFEIYEPQIKGGGKFAKNFFLRQTGSNIIGASRALGHANHINSMSEFSDATYIRETVLNYIYDFMKLTFGEE